MTPDAASSQPRKRAWKRLIVALACVVAVVTIVLLATPPKPEPVKVWFVRATNESGVKRVVFEGTNGTTREIEVNAYVITGAIRHVMTLTNLESSYDGIRFAPPVRTNFYFTLDAPPKDVPYYVAWASYDELVHQTPLMRFRIRCFQFFNTHGMPVLADRFVRKLDFHYIPSSEIEE